MNRLRSAAVSILLLAACGGSTDGDAGHGSAGSGASGGSGGTSSGGTAGAGGSGAVPAECAVETTAAAPYAVTFRFVNSSSETLYLLQDCRLDYGVTSCASGYADELSLSGACTMECSSPDASCVACGACAYQGKPVAAGGEYEDGWSGNTFTFGTLADGCSCHDTHDAPAGKYRISVPVYATDEAAQAKTPDHTVTIDFELPADAGVVNVPIAVKR